VHAGGLLALNQVLRKPWSGLDHLLDFDRQDRRWSSMAESEIMDLTCFVGYVDPARGSLGFCNGLWDVVPWVYPCLGLFVRNCKSINK
jgi:hypothetical protein